jgi:hypothetical protein
LIFEIISPFRQLGDRGNEEEELVIKTREVPIRDIPIRSGPSDHSTIWTVEKSKGEFSRFGILKGKQREKPVAL